MFRGLDESEAPNAAATPVIEDPLKGVFQKRMEEERQRIKQGTSGTATKDRTVEAENLRRMEEEARAKRDSCVQSRLFPCMSAAQALLIALTLIIVSLPTAGSTKTHGKLV